jgi:hypothetical protein
VKAEDQIGVRLVFSPSSRGRPAPRPRSRHSYRAAQLVSTVNLVRESKPYNFNEKYSGHLALPLPGSRALRRKRLRYVDGIEGAKRQE